MKKTKWILSSEIMNLIKMSSPELAKAIGVSPHFIRDLRHGRKSVPPRLARKIHELKLLDINHFCTAYAVDMSDIYLEESKK